jgi:transcription initiation factor TFIID subunit 10
VSCPYLYLRAQLTSRKRLLSLSAQKFVSDLSRDAFHFAKLRVNGASARGRPAAAVSFFTPQPLRDQADKQDRNKVTLTMDDLSLALGEHGVNVRKPDYCEPYHVLCRQC